MRESTRQRNEAAIVAIVIGAAIGHWDHSGARGLAFAFGIYVVMMLDFILESLDDFGRHNGHH